MFLRQIMTNFGKRSSENGRRATPMIEAKSFSMEVNNLLSRKSQNGGK